MIMRGLLWILILFCLTLFSTERAAAYAELNFFYMTDALNNGTADTSSKMFAEGSLGFGIDRENRYLVGWSYGLYSTSNSAATTTTYSSTQMGPRFLWFMTKAKTWSLGLTYNIVSTATYDNGSGSAEKWKGTSIKFDVGYNFPMSESWFVGVRLNYSSASYTERLVGTTTYSTVGYTSALTYPSIYSVYLF
jgi:hypothetical protein